MINTNFKNFYPQFMIIPSSKCQATCQYCFGPHKGEIMTIKQWDKTLQYIIKITSNWDASNTIRFLFHGGEPLLVGHQFFKQCLKDIESAFGLNRVKINIQSNLWELDSEFIKLFRNYKVNLSTSLDGPEKITDTQRGKGYFRKTWDSIKKARENGIEIGCIVTFTTQSSSHWKEILEFFKENHILIHLHPAIPTLGANENNKYAISPEQYALLLSEMFAYYLKHYQDLIISSFEEMIHFVVNGNHKTCEYGDCLGKFLAIDSYGNIYPCQRFIGNSEFCIGNISDHEGFNNYNIWTHPNLSKFYNRKQFLEAQASRALPGLKKYVLGGCPYQAFSAKSKNLHDPYWVTKKAFFDEIETKYIKEYVHLLDIPEASLGTRKLVNDFPITTIIKSGKNQDYLTRNAKRIIAAYLLGIDQNIYSVNESLIRLGLIKNKKSGLYTLKSFKKRLLAMQYNNLYIHLTWSCNLKCNHCYAPTTQYLEQKSDDEREKSRQNQKRIHFPIEKNLLKQIFFDAKNVNFQKIVITGGEPTCHPQFEQFVYFLKGIKQELSPLKLVLRSNWTLNLTEKLMTTISEVFDQIVVSVDGDQASHDKRRGKGSYQNTINNLKKYKELTFNTHKSARLHLACTSEFEHLTSELKSSVYNLAQQLGDEVGVRYRPILPIGKGKSLNLALKKYISSDPYHALRFLASDYTPTATCGLGRNLYVDPSGDVYPCYAYKPKGSILGNIFESSLEVILNSKKFQDLYNYDVDKNDFCRSCEVRYLCGGGCQAWNIISDKDSIKKPPSFCDGKTSPYYERALDWIKIAKEFLGINIKIIS